MKNTRLTDLIATRNDDIGIENYRIRYATERFLTRLSASQYKEKFVLKGGFLIGVTYNLSQRTTKDLDTALIDFKSDAQSIERVITEICNIDLEDQVLFKLKELTSSQDMRIYPGYRAKLKMMFPDGNTRIDFDLDIGVGDRITPEAKKIKIPLIFNEVKGVEKQIEVLAYPKETIQAEKLETILTRGKVNTRMKDYYDFHLLLTDQENSNSINFYYAFKNTWEFRNPTQLIDEELFEDWLFILDEILESKELKKKYWPNYIKDRNYAKHLNIDDIISEIKEFVSKLKEEYIKENMSIN